MGSEMCIRDSHRVIGSNGSLAGFGGGVRLKKSLLDLEARNS